jgi:hypothetical protein
VLAYDSATGLWKNETADQAGLVDLASTQTISGAKSFSNAVTVTNAQAINLNDATAARSGRLIASAGTFFIQGGVDSGDTASKVTVARANTSTTPVSQFNVFATTSAFTGDATVSGDLEVTGTLLADNAYVSTGVATASSGWTVASALFRKRNGIAMVNLGLTRTGATIAAGNITNIGVCTLASGYRPASEALAGGGPSGPVISAYINASGGVFITALASSLPSGDNIDINATFILA